MDEAARAYMDRTDAMAFGGAHRAGVCRERRPRPAWHRWSNADGATTPHPGGGRRRPAARPACRAIWPSEGFRVTTAERRRRGARTSCASCNPDLMVLDVMMPGESGLDLTEVAAPRAGHRSAGPAADRARRAGGPHRRVRGRRRRLSRQAVRAARTGAAHPRPAAPRAAAARRRAAAGPVQLGDAGVRRERGELRGAERPASG